VRDASQDLASMGVEALGISPDTPEKQSAFDRKYRLGFRLLSDPDHRVADAYGVWGGKSRYGREYEGIVRSSFLIDEGGRIMQAWYGVRAADMVPKAIEALAG
jgi:thioredoxin-dependent peroxiredoxin